MLTPPAGHSECQLNREIDYQFFDECGDIAAPLECFRFISQSCPDANSIESTLYCLSGIDWICDRHAPLHRTD
jgi:hypothetical protein